MPANNTDIEKRLWDAADELRANSKLKSSEYSVPVLGLIFLRYADHKFEQAEQEFAGTSDRAAAHDRARPTTRRAACSTCPTRRAFANLLATAGRREHRRRPSTRR